MYALKPHLRDKIHWSLGWGGGISQVVNKPGCTLISCCKRVCGWATTAHLTFSCCCSSFFFSSLSSRASSVLSLQAPTEKQHSKSHEIRLDYDTQWLSGKWGNMATWLYNMDRGSRMTGALVNSRWHSLLSGKLHFLRAGKKGNMSTFDTDLKDFTFWNAAGCI